MASTKYPRNNSDDLCATACNNKHNLERYFLRDAFHQRHKYIQYQQQRRPKPYAFEDENESLKAKSKNIN